MLAQNTELKNILTPDNFRRGRHKESQILSRSRRNDAVAKQYENNNKPMFINCEDLSRQAAVDEESPKGRISRL